MSTTEGALHVRAVAKGRSPLKPMSFFTDVVILVVVRCVVSVKGVVEMGVNTSISALALLLRHALFAWLILNGVAQHNRVGTTPRGRGRSPGKCVYIRVCVVGGAMRKQQHIFLQVAQ